MNENKFILERIYRKKVEKSRGTERTRPQALIISDFNIFTFKQLKFSYKLSTYKSVFVLFFLFISQVNAIVSTSSGRVRFFSY